MNDGAPEYPNLSHDEQFYDAARGVKGKIEHFVEDSIHTGRGFGIEVGEYAQLLIAQELEVISYSLWHIARAAEPKPRDLVAEFGPFMQRYIARNGEVSEEEARLLYQDFHGMQLEKSEE